MEGEKYCPKCFKKFPQETVDCPDDGQHLVSLMERDLVGEVLDDRYTVMELIGRGGMGVVYKAEQHLIKRIVALKVVRREVIQDETAVKRFLNEARAIASLQNPHTVTLHDFGVSREGLLYYTMELLQGQPLSTLIKEHAPLDYQRAAALLMEACDSLQEAHEANILHRDLKPDNLFIIARWEEEHVKVLDFGIAKLMGDTSMDTVTETGMIIGTPKYLSPEQALGNPCVPASDLYSLGIVFYEMLTGSPPFVGDTAMKTLWKHIQEPPTPIHVKNPSITVPKSIDHFLRRVLQKNAADRPQSAIEFRKELKAALQDHNLAPETVTLRPLKTTAEGARVITESMERPVVESGPPDSPETAAEAGIITKQEYASLTKKQQTESQSAGEVVSQEPGKGTQALIRSSGGGKMRLIAASVVATAVLLGLLAIWRPWAGKAEVPTAESGAAKAMPATAPDTTPTTALAGAAAQVDGGTTEPEPSSDVQTGAIAQESESEPAVAAEPVVAPPEATPPELLADEVHKAEAKLALAAQQEAARRLAEEVAARQAALEVEARQLAETAAAEAAAREAAKQAAAEAENRHAEQKARAAAREKRELEKKAEADKLAKELAQKKAAETAREKAEDDDFSEFK